MSAPERRRLTDLFERMEAGEEAHGFVFLQAEDFSLLKARVTVLEHKKTGARLTAVINEDPCRAFTLVYRTRAWDDRGLPHALEHVVLDGSEKYPSFSIFDNLSHQTYNTYANAYTDSSLTDFGAASLSEGELLRWADFYLDSTLHPLVREERSIFDKEVWHYRLDGRKAPLRREGVVLAEMMGEEVEAVLQRETYRAAFPGSVCGRAFAGLPEEIPKMTYEELLAFHERYYHPSGAMAYLYGKIERPEEFLALLDGAFSAYERREEVFSDGEYAALAPGEKREKRVSYPVEVGTDTKTGCLVSYSLVLPPLREEEHFFWETLCSLLDVRFSPVYQEVREALPEASFECALGMDGPADLLSFYGRNLAQGEETVFVEALRRGLTRLEKEGFDPAALLALERSRQMSRLLLGEEKNVGILTLHEMAYYYETQGDPLGYLRELAYAGDLSRYREGAKEAAGRLLSGDLPQVTVVLVPAPGEKEKRQEQERRELARQKAALSREEIRALLRRDEEEREEGMVPFRLSSLTISSLPEDLPLIPIQESNLWGVRLVEAPAPPLGVGAVSLYLDLAGFSPEDLLYLHLFEDLLGRMETKSLTRGEVDLSMERLLFGFTWGFTQMGKGTELTAWFSLEWVSRREDLAASYELVYALVFESIFTDADWIRQRVSLRLNSRRRGMEESPQDTLQLRAMARGIGAMARESFYGELEYVDFLQRAHDLLLTPEGAKLVTEGLLRVQRMLANKKNAISAFAGEKEDWEENRRAAGAFWEKLPEEEISPAKLSFPLPAGREALVLGRGNQVNVLAGDYKTLGFSYSAQWEVIVEVISDLYLFPVLREDYGVYTPYALIDEESGLSIISFQDPNIGETFEALEGLPEFLEELSLDQETLDGYILSAYTAYTLPEGPLGRVREAISDYLDGYTREEMLAEMRAIKGVKAETIRESAGVFRALLQRGARMTAGPALAIDRERHLFDRVYDPFGKKEKREETGALGGSHG